MGSRFKFSVICSSFLITILLVVGAVLGKSEEQEGAYRPLAVYTEILARIKSDYVEEPDIPRVTQGALQGLVEYLDPASSYLVGDQYGEYRSALESVDGGSGLSTGMAVRKQGRTRPCWPCCRARPRPRRASAPTISSTRSTT